LYIENQCYEKKKVSFISPRCNNHWRGKAGVEEGVGKSREEIGAITTGERQGKILLLPVAFLTFREAISSCNINTSKRRYVLWGRRENEKHEMHAK